MKIGIISDTHDLLRQEVASVLHGCDHILHGGDISSQQILDKLGQIAPVKAVRGNNDKEWAEHLPQSLDFEIGGLRFIMTHKKKDLPKDLGAYDVAVFGHSHQYSSVWLGQDGMNRTLMLNPGSCGPRRFLQPITIAILEIGADGWAAKRIDIPHATKEEAPTTGKDICQQIETVIRETQKGQTVESIASRHRMDLALAEQIARLYVTHPGVTVDGIMTKMGL